MTIVNSSRKAHIATLDTQPFMVDALHILSLKYDINNNSLKLKDHSTPFNSDDIQQVL